MGGPGLAFWLVRNGSPATWTPMAKDGYRVPAWQAASRRAVQAVSIGETYDFSVQAPDTASTTLELRTRRGSLVVAQAIRFVK
jgi:hypothetical protein